MGNGDLKVALGGPPEEQRFYLARNDLWRLESWKGRSSPVPLGQKLRAYAQHAYPNGFQQGNPHGIENCSTTPNTINEMLCMSHVPAGAAPGTQALRVFPAWPRGSTLASSTCARGARSSCPAS